MPERSIALSLYRALPGGIVPRWMGVRTPHDPAHPNEEYARYSEELLAKGAPVIWFHTANGSALGALGELSHAIADARPEVEMLITVSCPSDRNIDMSVFASNSRIVLTPQDKPSVVEQFLRVWQPVVAVWIGVDLRPNLIATAAREGVALFSIDGPRANPQSRLWRWAPRLRRHLLRLFARTLVGDHASFARRVRMGAHSWTLEEVGFLEEGAIALPYNESERADLAATLAARPIWLAAGVTPEEARDVLSAHRQALRRAHRLLLILVPAAPEQGAEIAKMATDVGLSVAMRGQDEEPDQACQVYIADTEGEMGLWYRLSPITFLGQSLQGGGLGRNPYEAAALGSAVIHGPNVAEHRGSYARLSAAGAAVLVRNTVELAQAIESLQAPDRVAEIAHAGWEVCSSGAEVSDRITQLIFERLDQAEAA